MYDVSMSRLVTRAQTGRANATAWSADQRELNSRFARRAGETVIDEPVRWRTIKVLIVLAWLYSLLPSLVGVVQNGRTLASTPTLSAAPSSIGSALGTLLSTLIIVIAAISVLGRRRPRARKDMGAFAVLALPWFTVMVANLFAGQGPSRQVILYPLLALMIWLEGPPVEVLRTTAPLIVTTAAVSLMMILVVPDVAYYPNPGGVAHVSKSILGSRLLAGPYDHPNLLGAVLALGLPSLLLIGNRRRRLLSIVLVAATVVMTSSRTSIVATGAVLVIYVVATRRPAWVRRIAAFLCTVGFGLLVLTPLLTTDPQAYSSRGQIWLGSLSSWHAHPFAGLGSEFFARIGQENNDLGLYAFTGHNLLVDTLARSGLVGALALLLMFARAATAAWSRMTGTVVGVAYLTAFVFEDWLEARVDLLNLGQPGFVVWIPFMVLICATRPGNATRLISPRRGGRP